MQDKDCVQHSSNPFLEIHVKKLAKVLKNADKSTTPAIPKTVGFIDLEKEVEYESVNYKSGAFSRLKRTKRTPECSKQVMFIGVLSKGLPDIFVYDISIMQIFAFMPFHFMEGHFSLVCHIAM